LQRFDLSAPVLTGAVSNRPVKTSSSRYFEPLPLLPPPAPEPELDPTALAAPLFAVPLALLSIMVEPESVVLELLAIEPFVALLSGAVDVLGVCCLVVPLALMPLSTLVDVEDCARAMPEVARPKPKTAENNSRDMVIS